MNPRTPTLLETPQQPFTKRIYIAPMIDYTHRHFRAFFRLISQSAVLYTEMITTQALLQGDSTRHLITSPGENPVVLQLGGSNPTDLKQCSQLGEKAGFNEINLNVGCPSDRVQAGAFGACLMKTPQLVATAFQAMQDGVSPDVAVSIKCRLGVDDFDSETYFQAFIETLVKAGCRKFIVHARKAWLKGLSPKQNRSVPPLHYDWVIRLKERFPNCEIILNGGLQDVRSLLDFPTLDGIMLGRKAYQDCYHFTLVDELLSSTPKVTSSRQQILQQYYGYVCQQYNKNEKLTLLLKPLFGLFHGIKGAKQHKQALMAILQSDNPLNDLTVFIDNFSEALCPVD